MGWTSEDYAARARLVAVQSELRALAARSPAYCEAVRTETAQHQAAEDAFELAIQSKGRKPRNAPTVQPYLPMDRETLAGLPKPELLRVAVVLTGALADMGAVQPIIPKPSETGNREADAAARLRYATRFIPIMSFDAGDEAHEPDPRRFLPDIAEEMLKVVRTRFDPTTPTSSAQVGAFSTNPQPKGGFTLDREHAAAKLLGHRNDVAAIPDALIFDERKRQLEAQQRAVVRVVASIQPPLVPGWSPPAVNENEVWAWQRLLDRLEAIDPSLARVEDIALYTVGLDGDRRQHFTTPEGAAVWTRVTLAAIDSLIGLIQQRASAPATPRRSDWPTAEAASERAVSPLNAKLLDLSCRYPDAASRPPEVAAEIDRLRESIMPTRLRVLAEHGWPLERDPATPQELANRLGTFDPDVTMRMAALAYPHADHSKLDPHAATTLDLWQAAERMADADPDLPRLPARPSTGRERWAMLRVWCDSCAEAERKRGSGFGSIGNPLLERPDIHPHLEPLFDAIVMVSVWSHAIDNSYSEMLALKVARGLPTADEWPDSPALRRSRVQHAEWVRAQREEYANRGEPVSIADFREPEWTEAMREWSDNYLKWCDAIAQARELAKSGAVAAIMDAGEARPAHKWTTQTIIDLDNLSGTLHPTGTGGDDGLGFIRCGLPPLPAAFPTRAEAVVRRIAELRAIPVEAVPAPPASGSQQTLNHQRGGVADKPGPGDAHSAAWLLRREIRAWVGTNAKLRAWLLDKWKQGRSLILANPLATERVKWSQFDASERPFLHVQDVVALHDVESAEPIVGDAHHTEWNRTDEGVDWAARGMAALGAMRHPCGLEGAFDPSLLDVDAVRESFEAIKAAAEPEGLTPSKANTAPIDPALLARLEAETAAIPGVLEGNRAGFERVAGVIESLTTRDNNDATSSRPTGGDLATEAGISDDTFRRVRDAAGIEVKLKGAAARKRRYPESEVDLLIATARDGNYIERTAMADKWARWGSRKAASKPHDSK